MVYRIDEGDQVIAGDAALPLSGRSTHWATRAKFFDIDYQDGRVRVARVIVKRSGAAPVTVVVGQKIARLYRLAAEFLVAIMVPLLVLMVVGSLIVWHVINQQLIPLRQLADSLNRQTHTSLEPVEETRIPLEIRPLTSAMNALLVRLKTALDAQRKFIADAAHQLRTPLTAIKLNAEQAAGARDPAHARSALRELRASTDRAVRLSNQLLSLARAEPGGGTAQFVTVDMGRLAFETGAEWVPRALASNVDLGFQPDHDACSGPLNVRGNPVLLRETIANLIDNALKYVPPHAAEESRVTVGIAHVEAGPGAAPTVRIVVEDNGPGVAAASQADLFKRFFRGDDASGRNEGSGLGLAIVRDIVELHRGTIHYEDNPEGGSRFVIELPLAAGA
jgi:signal transduction histidine kinase